MEINKASGGLTYMITGQPKFRRWVGEIFSAINSDVFGAARIDDLFGLAISQQELLVSQILRKGTP